MRSSRMSRRSFLIGLGGTMATLGGGFLLSRTGPVRSRISQIQGQVREQFRPTPKISDLEVLGQANSFDVCIIGSGPAGAVLGQDLVDRGFRTVILESGLDLYQDTPDARFSKLEVFNSSGAVNYPVGSTRIRGVGGTSNIWTGRCSRLHPLDFEKNAYTPENAAWPITYAEIEPYYDRAEKTLQVGGGSLSKYHATRTGDLPFPAQTDTSLIKSLMDEVNITVDDSPTSIGMWSKGPIRVGTDLLPKFTESPHATLISGVTATRLISDSTGHIDGVEIRTLDQEVKIVQAQTYVVACGTIETARLLLLSRSETFPNGIGNNYDQVGRYFMEHPNIDFSGTIPARNPPRSSQLARCHQFYEQFKQQGLGSVILRFWWRPQEPQTLRIGATTEMYPSEMNRITLSPDMKDYFGNPAADLALSLTENDLKTLDSTRSLIQRIYADLGGEDVQEEQDISWSHHHLGACRMGDDPTTSVVNRDLRVHESPNLYLIGSSVFVTGGASHPTLAITALSHRLAEHLITLNQGSADINRTPEPEVLMTL